MKTASTVVVIKVTVTAGVERRHEDNKMERRKHKRRSRKVRQNRNVEDAWKYRKVHNWRSEIVRGLETGN